MRGDAADTGRPNLSRQDAIPLALLVVAGIALGFAPRASSYDDAWITYRFAWNFAHVDGLVYNVGERYLGTSAPGYALLLGILGFFSPDRIPVISNVVYALAVTAIGLGLYIYGLTYRDRLTGFMAGLCFVVNPVAIQTFGGEMVPQVALAVWAFVADARGRPGAAVLIAAAAAMVRPDGLLLLAVIGIRQTWIRRQLPMREIALAGGVLAVWFGALWLYYGWPLPQTVGAKNAQRLSGIWRPFGGDLVGWYLSLTTFGSSLWGSRLAPGFTALTYLVGVGLLRLWWARHWWPVLAWPALYLITYRQLHLPFYHWYAVPPLLAFAVMAGVGTTGVARVLAWVAERVTERLRGLETARYAHSVCAIAVAIGAIVFMFIPLARFSLNIASAPDNPVIVAYQKTGRWLDVNTPPGSSVGYLEIGILGYYSRRTIIDPLGLVNPGVAPHVAIRDLTWAYRRYRPDYIVHNPVFFPHELGLVLDKPWFRAEYEHTDTLQSGRDQPLRIYKRVHKPD